VVAGNVAQLSFPKQAPTISVRTISNHGIKNAWNWIWLAGSSRGTVNNSIQGGNMKPGTKDQIEGKLHEVKGALKEKAGQLTKNPDVLAEGQSENLGGKLQGKLGQIEKVFEK
jgi:uncharacterized protein YjbJ (UPF0337 family)